MLKGIIFSAKSFPVMNKTEHYSIAKGIKILDYMSECENDADILLFFERYFSIILLNNLTDILCDNGKFFYNTEDPLSCINVLARSPNAMGRQQLIKDFASIKSAEYVNITVHDIDDASFFRISSLSEALQYICYKITRMCYPYWEALCIYYLSKQFSCMEEILRITEDNILRDEIYALFKNHNVRSNDFSARLLKRMSKKCCEHFDMPEKLEVHHEHIDQKYSFSVYTSLVKQESNYINYRSIFFEEGQYNSLEPFLPLLS